MSSSGQILSSSYVGCQIHGLISTKHHQEPRNRNPLVECCSPRSEVPLSFLSSSASSSPLIVNPRLKGSLELKNVLQGTQDWRAKREYQYAQMMKKNIKIPANYYMSTDPRKLPQSATDYNVANKRRPSNQDTRRSFFQGLNTPPQTDTFEHHPAKPVRRSASTYVARNCDKISGNSSPTKSCLKESRSRTIRPSHSSSGSDHLSLVRRPHSVDLGGLDRDRYPWVYAVPSKRVRPRDCDELPDEFRRAGIGVCFKGNLEQK